MSDKMPKTPKKGDSCPWCEEGRLTVSPSGEHFICTVCGRLVLRRTGLYGDFSAAQGSVKTGEHLHA